MCHFCQKWKNQNWYKPFSTNCATFPIDPKLAEIAPLLYRASDVPFLQKWNKSQNWYIETISSGTSDSSQQQQTGYY